MGYGWKDIVMFHGVSWTKNITTDYHGTLISVECGKTYECGDSNF
jgi:hypothetical protein